MASGSTWHPLPAFPGLPPLLVSLKLTASSYTLHITDLANIWVESLDRKRILLRSLQEDISIDLSDGDPDQWAVFLSKLNAAFDSTSPDHHSTSLILTALSPERAAAGDLVLHITCVLSQPLKPLKWPVYLIKCLPVDLASELVLPLIQAQHVRNLEIQYLISRLQEKDAVITKLVDKLEAMHTGLEHVFNSLSGKRKPSRAAAEEKVKGLATFNASNWRPSVNVSEELPRDVPALIRKVFNESGLHYSADAGLGTSSQQLSDWWTNLGASRVAATKLQNQTPEKTPAKSPPDTKAGSEKDDDFQVQVTPPHLQSQGRTIGRAKAANDSTDEDDSLVEIPDSHPSPSRKKPRTQIGGIGGRKTVSKDNSASQSSRTIPVDDDTVSESDHEEVQTKSPKRTNPRLGAIGRRKTPSSPPAKSPSPPPLPSKDDDETASSVGDSDDEPAKSRSRPPPAPTPRKKVGLGRIGGPSKFRASAEPAAAAAPKAATTPEADSSKATAASPAKPAGRKLGVIGKKPAESEGKKHQLSESPEEAAVESETEEQRTERRRAELAKELERKAAAPTKKKRRF
ncbi:XLF-domain-containing protein [Hypoxylon rubiginosum]|uniref:XLF-domain-containing protein n=1 Tax=Hypoxylon rubiginosum TaxID=110542 RepID=A0ACC0CQX4_9PEZI|nr:XLF-domain-containing protein [Hypoxylon rubiginosum]